MEEYRYRPLDFPKQETRLIELLPASSFEDPTIRVKIHHVKLPQTKAREAYEDDDDVATSFEQVEATLPPRWNLNQTPEGRYVFENQDEKCFQWEHPTKGIEISAYDYFDSTREANFEPKYEALSYAWGDDSKTHWITVEPVDPAQTFATTPDQIPSHQFKASRLAVTDSAYQALRYLRQSDVPRFLWVDGICIQQQDDVEKGQQVSCMATLYRLAYRVVVWLGPEADDSSVAIQTLKHIGSQSEVDARRACYIPSPDATEPEWANTSNDLPYSEPVWNAVTALLNRRWFTRIWVVQEVHRPHPMPGALVQCGADTIPYTDLRRAICYLEHRNNISLPKLKHSVAYAWKLFRLFKPSVLRHVIRTATLGRSCTDLRDKVYGTLGLAPLRYASAIAPDYSDGSTADEVYKTAFLTHVRTVNRLELLDYAYIAERKSRAPSWVPDWSTDVRRLGSAAYSSNLNSQFSSGTSRAHIHHYPSRPDVLEVLGLLCATISQVSQPYKGETDSWDFVQHVRQWRPQGLDELYEPTGEPLRTAYALTLLNNRVKERWPQYPFPSREEWLAQDYDGALFGRRADDDQVDGPGNHVQKALGYCIARVLVRTHEGYIGLAPGDTKPGDVIAIFLGCTNPMVLRPTTTDSYQIVGESYVYGLHDGIKFLGPLPNPWKVKGFYTADGRDNFSFVNEESGEETKEDPRLGPLSSQWMRIEQGIDTDDPIHYDFFRHRETGEVTNCDPRWEPEALKDRGIDLTTFSLV